MKDLLGKCILIKCCTPVVAIHLDDDILTFHFSEIGNKRHLVRQCGSPRDGSIFKEKVCYDNREMKIVGDDGERILAIGRLCLCKIGMCNGVSFNKENQKQREEDHGTTIGPNLVLNTLGNLFLWCLLRKNNV